MRKTAILSITESGGLFKPAYTEEEYGSISLITVKNSLRAINKLKKACGEVDLLLFYGDEKILKSELKVKKGISYRTALPVLEKICRQTAHRYGIQLPFGEVYVMASPLVACAITTCLSGLSKVFTVVSEESPLTNRYDELYFKHGTIIRHLPEFNNNITADSVIIRYSDDALPLWAKIPVIDFSQKSERGERCIKPENIYVNDENIAGVAKLWGGKSSLGFYELMEKIPGADAEVDINITADEIFLLDTGGI